MLFKPFDEQATVRIYYTSMPHWRQAGCTYFVTYRLADSIPEGVLREWEFEKLKWIQPRVVGSVVNRTTATKWQEHFPKLSESDKRDFLKYFNRKLNTYLDNSHGSCVLRRPAFAKIIEVSWTFFDGQRYELGDLVVMPNHVHVLLTPYANFELEDILRNRKRQSASDCNKLLKESGTFWQKHSFDHIVRDVKELKAFQGYIANNPVKAKLRVGEFLHRRHEWELSEC